MAVSFKGAHFPPDVILMGIRWYLASPLSTRHAEELMEEPNLGAGDAYRYRVDPKAANRAARR